jgi:hypothetical protein
LLLRSAEIKPLFYRFVPMALFSFLNASSVLIACCSLTITRDFGDGSRVWMNSTGKAKYFVLKDHKAGLNGKGALQALRVKVPGRKRLALSTVMSQRNNQCRLLDSAFRSPRTSTKGKSALWVHQSISGMVTNWY